MNADFWKVLDDMREYDAKRAADCQKIYEDRCNEIGIGPVNSQPQPTPQPVAVYDNNKQELNIMKQRIDLLESRINMMCSTMELMRNTIELLRLFNNH